MKLSKQYINSFCGDVTPIELICDKDISNDQLFWSFEGDCITVHPFGDKEKYSYKTQALVTLVQEGKGKIICTVNDEKLTCDVTVRKARKAQKGEKLEYFRGDFHDHTSNDHKYDSFAQRQTDFPIDYLNTLKKDNRLDFAVISDHADVTNDRDFFRGFTDFELAQPMKTVIFPGCESEITFIEEDRFGLTHKNSGEIVTVNSNNYAAVKTWQEFFDAFKDSPYGILVLAHPQVVGWDKNGIWNFSLDKHQDPMFKKLLCGVEMGNGSMRGSNAINELYYSVALDNGFKVSVTSSSDCHGPDWGFDVFPGKTIIMAPDNSKEMMLDALWNRRFYASESGNVKLYYTVNGEIAASTLDLTNEYSFHLECGYFDDDKTTHPIECQVISDGGNTVATFEDVDFSSFDFKIISDTASYFYLRLIDSEGRKTWSAPVWTGRKVSTPENAEDFTPLDKSDFMVTEAISGKDASVLVNNNPEQYWTSENENPVLVIDMKKEYDVCALAHYPARLLLKVLMAQGIEIPDKINELVAKYAISLSCDGKNYKKCAEGMFRIFGAEEIVPFEMSKARFVKFEVLSTVGKYSKRSRYIHSKASISELTIMTK